MSPPLIEWEIKWLTDCLTVWLTIPTDVQTWLTNRLITSNIQQFSHLIDSLFVWWNEWITDCFIINSSQVKHTTQDCFKWKIIILKNPISCCRNQYQIQIWSMHEYNIICRLQVSKCVHSWHKGCLYEA